MSGALDPDRFFELVLRDADGPGPRTRAEPGPAARWARWWQDAATVDGPSQRAASAGFVLGAAELADFGYTRSRARTLVGRGRWQSAGRGLVAPVDVRRELPDIGADAVLARRRHALQSSGSSVLRSRDAIACRSSAIVHGLPTMRVPERPELLVVGEVGLGRRDRTHLYGARLHRDEVTTWYGRPVTTVPRTLADLGRHDRFDAIMAADAALREELATTDQISAALFGAAGWPGVRQARRILALADPRAESPLESVTRLRIHDEGLPTPELQVWLGSYRVDFYWPQWCLVLEADGRIKYTADERWAEKKRELALRRLGAQRIERVVWADVLGGWPETARLLGSILR